MILEQLFSVFEALRKYMLIYMYIYMYMYILLLITYVLVVNDYIYF